MYILLDTDAAIVIARTELGDDFYTNLPVALTRYCYAQELPGLKKNDRPWVRRGAEKVAAWKQAGELDILPSTFVPSKFENIYDQLFEKYSMDAGEASILRCLMWDSSNVAVVSAQDSDARSAITEFVQREELQLQVGSPALALAMLIVQDDDDSFTVQRCLDQLKPEVCREGWDWNSLKPMYESEIRSVLQR